MSSIEERLQRDIAAVTQGVIVTEQHLREARSNVEEHIEIGQQRDRRRGIALVAAAAVVVPIVGVLAFQSLGDDKESVGPSNNTPVDPYASFLEGSAPTVDLLTGVWRQDNGFMLLRFQADGTVQFNDEGGLFSHPSTTGTYELDGKNLTITTTRDGTDGEACSGTVMALRASIPESGIAHLVNSGSADPCTVLRSGAQWNLERVLPMSHDYGDFMPPDDEYAPVLKPGLLYGDWAAAEGGNMIELGPDGTYVVAGETGELVDTGTWTLADRKLELVTGPDSPGCATGDRLVLGSLSHGDAPPSEFIRGTVTTNECAAPWAETDWFLLPNTRSH